MPVFVDLYLVLKLVAIFYFALACLWHLRLYSLTPIARASLVLFVVLSGFLGSKFWFLIQNEFSRDPSTYRDAAEAFDQAGSVLYGWILGGSLATWIGARALRIQPQKLFDGFLPPMLFAQILNRIGCLDAGCCWGKGPCSLPWAVQSEWAGMRVHPVQAYEAIYDLVLLITLLVLARRTKGRGIVAWTYFVGYAAGRLILEFYRGDNLPVGGLTVPQWTSLIVIFGFLVFRKKMIKSS